MPFVENDAKNDQTMIIIMILTSFYFRITLHSLSISTY